MEKNKILFFGLVLILLLLCWLIFVEYVELGSVKDGECEKLDLKNEEGGNCCFVDDNEEGLLPNYRAVPCDNLDYVPLEKQIERGNLSNLIFPDLNVTVFEG